MLPNIGARKRCCRLILSVSIEIGPQQLLHERWQHSFLNAWRSTADADGNDRLVDGSQPDRCVNVTALMAVANQPGCIGSAAVDHKPSTATGRV